ncbi:MAG TPA: NAD(P)/FAD-dependent oxidoreductase [Chitinophagaceae bacterium]
MEVKDVIIVGGGPAGLNAAIVLGRCQRSVLLFDTQEYRNRFSHGMHNYLTRDDILPTDFISLCHTELDKYEVNLIKKRITHARKDKDGLFIAKDEDGTLYYAKKMLIATGVRDHVPKVPGFEDLYGKSVFHCPYCDGWEVRNQRIGVYAPEKDGSELAISLKAWSNNVTLYTEGKKIKKKQVELLHANGIIIDNRKFKRLEYEDDKLKNIVFKNGEEHPCDAIFFVNGYEQQCDLARVFNCEISKKGVVVTNRFQQTSTPGLFVAGDADKDVQFVVVAAAEGAKAGVIINKELIKENSKKKLKSLKH